MAKIAQVSAKYIVHANIVIEGTVDKPDVIGAIFGQTEGLLGSDLELRELQRSGRIGRIEVNVTTKGSKTTGEIILPSSLDKSETAIVAASLEIIQRIGPCNSIIKVTSIEDIRISKRKQVVDRAKELLRNLIEGTMPDSQELSDEVAYSVRVMEITEYGKDKLPAGPAIDESDEIILVEGRADVLNLLKHGFKNAIAINGTSMPPSIVDICKSKIVTVFVDGDRGGDLIIRELMGIAEIDFVTKAPDGKELEELTKKEIHKALRSKITGEQYMLDHSNHSKKNDRFKRNNFDNKKTKDVQRSDNKKSNYEPPKKAVKESKKNITAKEKETFTNMVETLIGTRGAYILDNKLNILGKVPVSELLSTIKSLRTGMYAVIFDGIVDRALAETCEINNVNYLVGMSTKVKSTGKLQILTVDDLE